MRGAFEQVHAAQTVAGGERHQQVFLAGEMLVQRADGVVAFLGDASHLQRQQSVTLDQLLCLVEEALFALAAFAQAAVLGAHGGSQSVSGGIF